MREVVQQIDSLKASKDVEHLELGLLLYFPPGMLAAGPGLRNVSWVSGWEVGKGGL